MKPTILANPFTREIDELLSAYQASFDRVLRSGWYILGKEVEAFERELAEYLDGPRDRSTYVIGCASGLDALMLSLRALGIGPGDEVITTPLSAAATALAITHLGARPVFVDLLPNNLTLDPEKFRQAVTPKTRAVIPVHLYGTAAETKEIQKICDQYNIHLVEDCAQSIGAKDANGRTTGLTGKVGCFSFYPTKNLGAFGDAGAVCTSSAEIAAKVKKLRNYGQRARYDHEIAGYNSRLDEMQAAILREKLKHLDRWTNRRREIARRYDEVCRALNFWHLPEENSNEQRSVYHLYPIQVAQPEKRGALLEFFKQEGIEGSVHYPTLIPEQECYSAQNAIDCSRAFPVAWRASRSLVSLPINPYLSDREIEKVSATLRRWSEQQRKDSKILEPHLSVRVEKVDLQV